MTWLELKIPPPIVALIFLIDLGFVAYLYPTASFAFPNHTYIAIGIGILGLIICGLAVWEFKRTEAVIDPRRPELAQHLVTHGIFKYSRNPMYLGLFIIICAAMVYVANAITLIHPILFVLYIHFFQIKPEERALLDKFGEDYLSYMTHTRRWL